MANRLPEKLEKPFILESTTLPSTVTQEKCTYQKSSTTLLYYSLNWNPSQSPIAKCQDLLLQSLNLSIGVKEVFAPPGSVNRDVFMPPIGVKHPGDKNGSNIW